MNDIGLEMQDEHPNRRLNTGESFDRGESFSSASTMPGEESFLPKGNKLVGCMFIFFLFSGGFIGSFFALDALEEPEPNSFNAKLEILNGACNTSESGCDKLEGLITVSKPEDCTINCEKIQMLKLQVNGLKNNVNISRVSIHEGGSCEPPFGPEYFKQDQTKIYNTSAEAAKGSDRYQAVLKIDEVVGNVDPYVIKFQHLFAAAEYGVDERLPTVRITTDLTCDPAGGEFAHDMEIIPAVMYQGANVTGSMTFAHRSGGGFSVTYAFDSTTSEKSITMKKIRILEAKECAGANKTAKALLEIDIPTYEAFEATGDHEYGDGASVTLADLRGHAAAIVDEEGIVSACGLVPTSPYALLYNISKSYSQPQVNLGYRITDLRSRACVVASFSGATLGCGLIPDTPYAHESFDFTSSDITDESGSSYKKVSAEIEINTNHDFYTFEGKVGIVEDRDGTKIACGVLTSAT